MNKICKGCGSVLQDSDPNSLGYVLSIEHEYCQRCYKLSHYGEILDKKRFNNDQLIFDILKEYKDKALYFYVSDVYDSLALNEDLYLNNFIDYPLVLIINKIDLLPINAKEDTIEKRYFRIAKRLKKKYPNLKDVFLTYKDDNSFIDSFNNYLTSSGYNRFIFFGKTNAGKSTLINKLTSANITTSIYMGTTLNKLIIENNGYEYIDTPGLDDKDNLLTYFNNSHLKDYLKYKTIRPLIFQVYEPQCYYMSGLFRISVYPKKECSIIFEGYREDIHRTSENNKDEYFEKHKNDFVYKVLPWNDNEYFIYDKKILLIKGFGIIRIKGESKIIVSINDNIKIHECEEY